MSFDYKAFNEKHLKSHKGRLEKEQVENLLTFDSGLMTDKFPGKRITIERLHFKETKSIAGVDTPTKFFSSITNILVELSSKCG